MDFNISKEQEKIISEIKVFSNEVINKLDYQIAGLSPFSKEDWRRCGEIKLHGLPIPEEFGGRGLDAVSTALALEELGYSCIDAGLPFAIAAQMLSCLVPIWKFGNNEQKEELLPHLCRGEKLLANSITEKDSGSDVYNMAGRAEKIDDNIFQLNAEKTMITNAPIADGSLLYLATQAEKGYFGGISAFIVDHNLSGAESEEVIEKIGLESVQMGKQQFKNVRIDKNKILGQEGSGGPIFALSMDWERACLGAVHVGLMRKILEFCINFVKKRKVGNTYISKHQAVSHKIANMKVSLHISRLALYQAAWSLDNQSRPGLSASISKLYISESLEQVCRDAFHIMGGAAYLKGSFIETYLRDSLSATIYSGTSDIQRNIIAKNLGI
ncbi:MAG: acyl-CoA dehydrogenase [Saprospirales bacterium]|nr:MAG: acyl-CoA dehydrogenase [Saprospirales bacterium]